MEIVQIDSVSKEEREMVDRLINELKEMNLEVKEDNTADFINGNAGNIIFDIPADNNMPKVLLSAHLDRVEPGRGIEPIIKDGYIISKGDTVLAGDDLIGVAAIIEVIKVLRENNLKHRPIKVIFTVAEEIGLLGAKHLDPRELDSIDYGLVFDVDGDIGTVVHRAPSQIKFNAKIEGKSAHAGIEPAKGINAIKIASLAISNMKLGQIDEKTTANIGVIKGGRASNIVPDMVELEGEVRSHSDQSLEKQQNHMKDLIDRSCKKYKGMVKYDIEKVYSSFAIPNESDIIKFVENVINKLDLEYFLTSSGGGSDANIFNNIGLPTLNFGVGMENVHSTNERVKVENLYILTNLIFNLLIEKDA